MRFRPCIDIHNGQVKQIVGGSLKDQGNEAKENFVSSKDGTFYGNFYKERQLSGGHVILLNKEDSPYYNESKRQAIKALKAYPGGLQAGGGMTPINAEEFLDAGASHIIVTSYVFQNGRVSYENLETMKHAVGKEHLVLDVSCRKRGDNYFVVTDRWQVFTEEKVTPQFLDSLSEYCDEYLVHGVDVEGKSSGIELELASLLGNWGKIPITYAGGVGTYEDLEMLHRYGHGKLDVTIGSSLDLFGGKLELNKVVDLLNRM